MAYRPALSRAAIAAFAAAALASLPGPGIAAQAPAPGILRLAVAQEPESLDLHAYSTAHHAIVARLFAGTLLDRDETGAIRPAAVRKYVQVSPLEWVFTLRDDVLFHNGQRLRAEDAAYSLERIGRVNRKDFATIAKVEALDALSFRVTTVAPDPLLPSRLVPLGFVVPKREVEAAGGPEKYFAAGRISGYGPYRLAKWEKGRYIELTAFESYYGRKPAPAAVRFLFEPLADRRVALLLSGEADIVADLPPISLLQVQKSGKASIVKGSTSQYLFGNYRIDSLASPLADLRVRRALNLALDRPKLIQLLELGNGSPIPTVFVREAFGYLDLALPAYDPRAARALLAEAGYGSGLPLTMLAASDLSETAKAIKKQFAEIGVSIEISEIKRDEGILGWLVKGERKEDIFLLNPVDPMIDAGYHVETLIARYPRQALPFLPELAALFAASNATLSVEERASLLGKVQRRMHEESLYLFLWQRLGVYGVSSRVKGWKPDVDGLVRIDRLSLSD